MYQTIQRAWWIRSIRAKSVRTICILLKRKHQREFISRDSCLLPISYLVSSFDITFVYRSLSLLRRFVNHSICPINVNAYKYFCDRPFANAWLRNQVNDYLEEQLAYLSSLCLSKDFIILKIMFLEANTSNHSLKSQALFVLQF